MLLILFITLFLLVFLYFLFDNDKKEVFEEPPPPPPIISPLEEETYKKVPLRVLSVDLTDKGSKENPVMYLKDKLFSGIAYNVYDNGQLNYEINYQKGEQHGVTQYWDRNGVLASKANYKNGKEHGVFQTWDENGQLSSQDNYQNGRRHGVSQVWLKNGELFLEEIYKDGELISSKRPQLDKEIDELLPKFIDQIILKNKIEESSHDKLPEDKSEPIRNDEPAVQASYKEDFLYKGLNRLSALLDDKEIKEEDWNDFIQDDPKSIFHADPDQESEKGLKIKNLFFRNFKISVTKFNINSAYLDFYLRERHFPGQRVPPINSLQELASMATYEELLIFLLTSPSFSRLVQGKDLVKKYSSGYFKQISPRIKNFYFPPIALQAIPDVILWYYSETDLKSILDVTGGKVEDILDDEGFIKIKHWPALIDNYVSETNEPLENIRSWEH